jgi:hypothetical protein
VLSEERQDLVELIRRQHFFRQRTVDIVDGEVPAPAAFGDELLDDAKLTGLLTDLHRRSCRAHLPARALGPRARRGASRGDAHTRRIAGSRCLGNPSRFRVGDRLVGQSLLASGRA